MRVDTGVGSERLGDIPIHSHYLVLTLDLLFSPRVRDFGAPFSTSMESMG